MNIIAILAIIISPIVAVLISIWIQNRLEKRRYKLSILSILMSTRLNPLVVEENVRALNMIDMTFYNKPLIRNLWREYFDMLCNEGLNNPLGWEQRKKKNIELIHEMAKELGYGKGITHLDVERAYYPIALGLQAQRTEEIGNELLRVLKESGGLKIMPKEKIKKEEKEISSNNHKDTKPDLDKQQ